MKRLTSVIHKTLAIGLVISALIAGNSFTVFGHGGEDHGGAKPKTETTGAGTISHVIRLGDLEAMLKHPLFQPDTATTARLFVTKFETNQGFAEVTPTIEVESSNNSVVEAKVEKTEAAGVFNVAFPALAQGTYTIRTKLAHDGETDTATFSGVEVKTAADGISQNGEMSWLRTILIATVFLMVLGLFGGLAFFVWRHSAGESFNEKTVSV